MTVMLEAQAANELTYRHIFERVLRYLQNLVVHIDRIEDLTYLSRKEYRARWIQTTKTLRVS
jgi:hypothetical protein